MNDHLIMQYLFGISDTKFYLEKCKNHLDMLANVWEKPNKFPDAFIKKQLNDLRVLREKLQKQYDEQLKSFNDM